MPSSIQIGVLFLLVVIAFAPPTFADTVSLQSDHFNFELRVDDAPDAGIGNMDFRYRGIDFGVSDAWFLSSGGNSTQFVGGSVVDGGPEFDEKVWTVRQGDMRLTINFFAGEESFQTWPNPQREGIFVTANVELFNESTSETNVGSLLNYSEMQVPNQDGAIELGGNTQSIWFDEGENNLLLSYATRNTRPFQAGSNSRTADVDFMGMGDASVLLQEVRSGNSITDTTTEVLEGLDIATASQWNFELAPQTGMLLNYDFSALRSVPEPGVAVFGTLLIFVAAFSRRRHDVYRN